MGMGVEAMGGTQEKMGQEGDNGGKLGGRRKKLR